MKPDRNPNRFYCQSGPFYLVYGASYNEVQLKFVYNKFISNFSKDYGRAFNTCFGFHFPFTNRHDAAGSSIIRNGVSQHVKISKVDIVRPWTNIQSTPPPFIDRKLSQRY